MTEAECGSIQAFKGMDENNRPFLFTVWVPTDKEIENINKGMPICLKMFSHTFIPTAMFTVDEDQVEG